MLANLSLRQLHAGLHNMFKNRYKFATLKKQLDNADN